MFRVAIEHDVTIVVTAHPSRDGIKTERGDSGSTAWSNSVRSRLYLMDDPNDADCRTLKVAKANYGKKGDEVRLRWVFGTFHALGHAADKTAHGRAAEKRVDELFLEILAEFTTKGNIATRAPTSPDYAPKAFAAHPNAKNAGVNFVGFKLAMQRLFAEPERHAVGGEVSARTVAKLEEAERKLTANANAYAKSAADALAERFVLRPENNWLYDKWVGFVRDNVAKEGGYGTIRETMLQHRDLATLMVKMPTPLLGIPERQHQEWRVKAVEKFEPEIQAGLQMAEDIRDVRWRV